MIDPERLEAELLALGLSFPEAAEDHPWGERVLKVRKKIFLFLNRAGDSLHITAKLPASHEFALIFDPCTPTGYGLGKSGWVTTRLTAETDFDTSLLRSWVEESYRAIAPKALMKGLAARAL